MMLQGGRRLSMMALCTGLALPACMPASQPAMSRGFFAAPPQETVAVQALIREQERHVQTCAAARSCPRAHYMRGLAALYEDRRIAEKHFQAVLAETPEGAYAASSRYWMQLLGDGRSESVREANLVRAMERLVRAVLEDETTIRQALLQPPEPGSSAAELKEAPTVQALTRKLREREKKIDELTRQIDALKRVDQEVKDRVKPGRPAN